MVAEHDNSIVRIMARIRPLDGEREACTDLIKQVMEIARPHARDYQYYDDPETGDIVNWQSFDSVDVLLDEHSPSVRKTCEGLVSRSEVVKYHVYVDNNPAVLKRLKEHWDGWLPAVFMLPI